MILFFRRLIPTLLALCALPICSGAQPTNDAIARANAAVKAATPRAQSDPARPIFHVASPAQWMNDPNGPIYYKGFYHLFYQLHPFSDESGPKYWGHVRSHDLVKWEHLPVAVAPSGELGESEIWSGCCTINGEGRPMIFYTSIAPGKSAQTHAEQWAAIGDDDLITWRKSPANPVLSEALHGGKKIYEWRDPFIFREQNRTFLVTGGNLNETKGGEATVNIYEAENPALTQWKYRGVLFTLPDASSRTAECPNFFKLDGHWVLFVSPYGKVNYFVGDFDPKTCRFQAHTRGLADFGPNFYAPNTMQLPGGRRLVWGWVTGFPGGRGWNGCLTLPRELSLSSDGQLRQIPAPELARLRGKPVELRNATVNSDGAPLTLMLPRTNTLEIRAEIDLKTADSVSIAIKSGAADARPIVLNFDRSKFKMPGAEAPFSWDKTKPILDLRLFIDRSVLEVFANETLCATKVISPLGNDAKLEISSEGSAAKAKLIQAWPMKTIW
jgi:beta-fructofuranosidase